MWGLVLDTTKHDIVAWERCRRCMWCKGYDSTDIQTTTAATCEPLVHQACGLIRAVVCAQSTSHFVKNPSKFQLILINRHWTHCLSIQSVAANHRATNQWWARRVTPTVGCGRSNEAWMITLTQSKRMSRRLDPVQKTTDLIYRPYSLPRNQQTCSTYCLLSFFEAWMFSLIVITDFV